MNHLNCAVWCFVILFGLIKADDETVQEAAEKAKNKTKKVDPRIKTFAPKRHLDKHEDPEAVRKFQCKNGNKIPMEQYCDHHADCGDQSDEVNCIWPKCKNYNENKKKGTATGEFTCDEGLDQNKAEVRRCIEAFRVGDRHKDCDDNSDEKTCKGFQCYDGRCLDEKLKCDAFKDCTTFEDEKNCKYPPIVTPQNTAY